MKEFLLNVLIKIIQPFRGSWIGNYYPFNLINKKFSKIASQKEEIVQTKYGFKMNLTYGKAIDQTIIFSWMREKNITNLVKRILKNWDTFLDIWANIWYYTLLWSNLVGQKGKVISFEPDPGIFEKLKKNVKLNNVKNVTLHNVGVGNKKILWNYIIMKKIQDDHLWLVRI